MTTFPPALGFRSSKREHRIVIIDGPNMSNLGARNKRVYGAIASLQDLQDFCKNFGGSLGVNVTTFSSNFEGAILEYISRERQFDRWIRYQSCRPHCGWPGYHARSHRDGQTVCRSALREHRSAAHRATRGAHRTLALCI
jgi:hypothetical protein